MSEHELTSADLQHTAENPQSTDKNGTLSPEKGEQPTTTAEPIAETPQQLEENALVLAESPQVSAASPQVSTDDSTEAPADETVYFEDLALSEDVLDALWDMRFEKCTPVQARCIPHLLEGKDLIGIAQTGTGKTAAYLLPMLSVLRDQPHPHDAVNCLIMSPTRELAQQIDQALQGFAYYTRTNSVAVYGGNDGIRFEQERKAFAQGADIIVATPGRLISHLQLGNLDLSRTTHIILDEADRMLDMGFFDDIMTIIKQLPAERQTVLFSATMPPEIAKMAREVMRDPVEIKIAVSKPAEKIDQSIYICRDNDKTPILKHIFSEGKPERVIVFISSKQRVKELNVILKRRGFNCAAMHSDLEQSERDEVMLGFKQRKIDILIATDIVSRGIDIDDIQMVINYDAPRDPEDYVHRIGRTARAGRAGRAITLIGEKDRLSLNKIERLLETKIPRNPLPEGCKAPEPADDKARGRSQHSGKSNRRDNKGQKSNGKNNRRQSNSGGERGKSTHHSATGATSNEKSAGSPASKRRGGRHRSPRKDNPQTEA
jgi:ATP-dependent RNA helicase, DEAD/DEAH box family